jgi:hypothetical protein
MSGLDSSNPLVAGSRAGKDRIDHQKGGMAKANKGYDDTKELEAMAAGIRNGIYGSVEQAAKSVPLPDLSRKIRWLSKHWRSLYSAVRPVKSETSCRL